MMKLSEMNSDQLLDAMMKISSHASKILNDPDVEAAVKKAAALQNKEGATVAEKVNILINDILPLLVQTHRGDVLEIAAALTGKTVADIRKQNGLQTLKEVKESFDKELFDFFKSAVGTI